MPFECFFLLFIFINFSPPPNLSIPPPPYFHQFLVLLIFINSSSSLFLSIPPPPYFHQFLLPLLFINSSTMYNITIYATIHRKVGRGDVIKIESNDFHCIGIGIGHENGIFDQILASNLVSNGDKGSVQPLSEALTAGYLRGCKREEGERYTKREKLPDARHPNDSVPESISSYELVGCGPISHP